MAFRRKMTKSKSRRSYRKGLKVKKKNYPKIAMRGGIRL